VTRRRTVRVFFAAVAWTLCVSALPAFPVDRIRIDPPLVDPQTAEAAQVVGELMEQVAALSNRLNGGRIALLPARDAPQADYALAVVASLGKESPSIVISLERKSDGARSAPYPWLGMPTPELPSLLARAVLLLWGSMNGLTGGTSSEPPVLVDELPTGLVSSTAYPYGIAAKRNGNILAALLGTCLEFDSSFRVVDEPGKSLAGSGTPYYAMGVSVNRSGTVLLKPMQGRDLYRILADGAPQKVSIGLELSILPFAALPDGSALVVDPQARKAYRFTGKQKKEIPLFASPYDSIYSFGVGPDGTIWIYDFVLKAFRIHTPEGRLAGYQLPLLDPSRSIAPQSMSIAEDGSFVVLANGLLAKFSRDGSPVWELTTIAGAEQEALPASGSVAVDWERGLIYVADVTGRRIVKLLDRAYCRQKGIRNEGEETLVALRERRASDGPAALSEAARLYARAGATLMARAYWEKVRDADPENTEAKASLLAIEVADLAREAADLDRKTRETLRTIGVESARLLYGQAMQKYELIVSKDARNDAARRAMEDLKALFGEKGGGAERKAPLAISDAQIANLFPSLMQWYAAHPVGTVTVKNTLTQQVEKVRATVLIPRLMDFPSETRTLPALAAGASASFDLSLAFNSSILEQEEDMAVQAKIDVTCVADGVEQTVSRVVTATIYRNTALTWDDTAKIASFVTPNEETVSGFAHRVLGAADEEKRFGLSGKLFRAIRLCDALGAYGVAYVEDQVTPISKILGRAEILDTVQFPRTTLYDRTGDCDDTTALLASLLESVGVQTAVLTTPGHIFLAFDSGEPAESAPFLSAGPLEVIASGGRSWVPVETTALRKGFLAAWAAASETIRRSRAGGQMQFLALEGARNMYPALPLPSSTLTVIEPAKSGIDRAYESSLTGMSSFLYAQQLTALDGKLAGLTGRQAGVLRVQQGILHALFGKIADAERSFRTAMAEDPTLVSPYVNAANLKWLARDPDGALAVVQAGLAMNAGSALLNLLAARILSDKGDAGSAARYFAKVKSAAPDLAARYAALVSPGTGAQRAAQAEALGPVIWSGD